MNCIQMFFFFIMFFLFFSTIAMEEKKVVKHTFTHEKQMNHYDDSNELITILTKLNTHTKKILTELMSAEYKEYLQEKTNTYSLIIEAILANRWETYFAIDPLLALETQELERLKIMANFNSLSQENYNTQKQLFADLIILKKNTKQARKIFQQRESSLNM